MAKTSYLNLTNKVLRQINQTVITDVTAATGHALLITNYLNEAQIDIYNEANWYSLFKSRVFKTVEYTASTIAFTNANPDTITDSASGFGNFSAGMFALVDGSTSNDAVYRVATAAVGTLTLDSTEALTVEAAGASVTITAITYPIASDFGRHIDLVDETNDRVLIEDYSHIFDYTAPDVDKTDEPQYFSIEGAFYRLYPVPSEVVSIRERYWKVPVTLAANADTSDLPIECENLLIQGALFKILEYQNKFEYADRVRSTLSYLLEKAIVANQIILNKMFKFQYKKKAEQY